MSNEELVTAIQDGHRQHIETLWQQIERFVKLQASKYLRGYPKHIEAMYSDDLYQAGYFALLDAIRTYRADGGKSFVGWLAYHLQNHFNNTMGQRTLKDKKAPHNNAISLETPFLDADNMTLADTIIDPDGETAYQEILDAEEMRDINQFIMRAIKTLPEEIGAYYMLYFIDGRTQKEASKMLGISVGVANWYQNKGGALLRRWMDRNEKERQEIGIDDLMSLGLRSSLRSYQQHIFTSATEVAAMRQLEQWEAECMIDAEIMERPRTRHVKEVETVIQNLNY